MKATLLRASLLLLLLASAPSARAVTETFSYNPGLAIPDGNPSGASNVQTPATTISSITNVMVSVSISGTLDGTPKAFNGDLYLYLTHGPGFAILLNRVGRTATNIAGYADNGFSNVTFSDAAANDIHLYQSVSLHGAGQPLLGGLWKPDGRNIDPNLAQDTTTPTAFLSSFNTLDAHGAWTLYAADVSTGEQMTLDSWSLQLTGTAIPEPATAGLLVLGWGLIRLRRRSV